MRLTLDIPEEVMTSLATHGKDPERLALEALAVEGSRSETLSDEQVRIMLGFETRMQVDAFLKEHEVYMNYTTEDLERDVETSRLYRERLATQQFQAA